MKNGAPLVLVQKPLRAMLRDLDSRDHELSPGLGADPWRPLEHFEIALPSTFRPQDGPQQPTQPGIASPPSRVELAPPTRFTLRIDPNRILAFMCGLIAPGAVCLLAGTLSMPSAPELDWAHARLNEVKLAGAEFEAQDMPRTSINDGLVQGAFANLLAVLRSEAISAERSKVAEAGPQSLDSANEAKPLQVAGVPGMIIVGSETPSESQSASSGLAVKPADPAAVSLPPAAVIPSAQPKSVAVAAIDPKPSRPQASESGEVHAELQARVSESALFRAEPAKTIAKPRATAKVRVAGHQPLAGETRLGAVQQRTSAPARRQLRKYEEPQRTSAAEQPKTSPSFFGGVFSFLGF